MTSSTPTIGTKVGRARRSPAQLWQVPTFLVGLLALLGAAVSAPWRVSADVWEFDKLAAAIRVGLENSGEPGEVLVVQANHALRLQQEKIPARAAEAHFLLGSAYYRLALQKPAAHARELWPQAVDNLDKALNLNLAENDVPPAQYRLGHSLYQLGKDIPHAIELMTQSVDKGAQQPLRGYQILVEANLKLAPPNLDAALTASRRVLDLTAETNLDAITQARLELAELLCRKEARLEALKLLDEINPKAPKSLRIRGRLLQARCCEEEGNWGRAIAVWKELLPDALAPEIKGGQARIFYAIGSCYKEMDPPKVPEAINFWTEALKLGGQAGQAAGLEMGQLRLQLGEKEYARALENWTQALESVAGTHPFDNPYVPLNDVKQFFDGAIKLFNEKQDPQKTQVVGELYRKIAPGGAVEKILAEAAEANAVQVQKSPGAQAAVIADRFRAAGMAYEVAFNTHAGADRSALLWRSIKCYQAAKDAKRTQELLLQFVNLAKDEGLLAEGWFMLGDLYRSFGNKNLANRALLKCREYPGSPYADRAGYLLALAEIDKGDSSSFDRAKKILEQVYLSPHDAASREKALFKLAWVFLKMQDYPQAYGHLKACLGQYPNNANVIGIREQLGECCRRLALAVRAKEVDVEAQLKRGEVTAERRNDLEAQLRDLRKTRKEYLKEAIGSYQLLLEELAVRTNERPLTMIEQQLLRRARFGEGECRLDMDDLQEAVRIFADLQQKHRRTLEGFFAALRIGHVAEVYGQTARGPAYREQAKESLQFFLEDFNAMPIDHEVFRTKNTPSREQWQRWASALQKRLAAPGKEPPRPPPGP